MRYSTIAATAGLAAGVLAQRAVPSNVKSLYSEIKGNGCKKFLQQGFYSEEGGSKDFGYCGDHLTDEGIVYITGKKGKFANMDVDCDGAQSGPGRDGRCGSSTDTQSQTTWQDEAAKLSGGKIKDLNAFVHTYVVFGNDDTKPAFDPRQYGIEPLSLMAVVCGDKMVYGVWGDTNGNDGPPLVGEAAISTGTLCYGKNAINGNQGHDADDVLYIAFTGKNAVPKNANWGAQSAADFEKSLQSLGDQLTGKIGGGSAAGNSTAASTGGDDGDSTPTATGSAASSGSSSTAAPTGSSSGGDGGDDGSDGGDDGNDGGDDGNDGGDDGSDGGDDGDDGDDKQTSGSKSKSTKQKSKSQKSKSSESQ